jgi:hypothetical protein
MWLMIRNIYLKYKVYPFRNKEVTVNSSRGNKSENIGARVMNLVT